MSPPFLHNMDRTLKFIHYELSSNGQFPSQESRKVFFIAPILHLLIIRFTLLFLLIMDYAYIHCHNLIYMYILPALVVEL